MKTTIIKDFIGYGGRDEHSDLWPDDAPQQRQFHYSLYEIEIGLEVDLDTGKSRIVTVEGVELKTLGGFY